jgi:hypothetical protein
MGQRYDKRSKSGSSYSSGKVAAGIVEVGLPAFAWLAADGITYATISPNG